MKKIVSVTAAFLLSSSLLAFDKMISQEEYINTWAPTAVRQMASYKIPASIILAQGILESGNGNSELAKKGNNHFGIKCHEWTGEKMFVDDDKKGECFRVYTSGDDSFRDHSLFLTGRSRYATLFNLKPDDYKGWAKGLKEAGYATNPKYPEQLIDLIERLDLDEYDTPGLELSPKEELIVKADKNNPKPAKGSSKTAKESSKSSARSDAKKEVVIAAGYSEHAVKVHKNKINYVVAKKGDTFYKIAQEFDMGMWQLYRYNDYGKKKDLLDEGDIVYLQPKRHRSKTKGDVLVTKKVMTVAQISQQEGIKVDAILNMNNLSSADETVPKGQKIILR